MEIFTKKIYKYILDKNYKYRNSFFITQSFQQKHFLSAKYYQVTPFNDILLKQHKGAMQQELPAY